jgi:large subunit ribosomal protein L30e
MSSVDRELRMALSTGRVEIGSKEGIKEMRRGRAQLAIISENCPEEYREKIMNYADIGDIPVMVHNKDSLDMGTLCGKPYPVSTVIIMDPGDSRILDLARD